MEEGQKALDISVPVKGKQQRVSAWKGQYIVFLPTDLKKGIWHNYICSWDELGQDKQEALGNKGKSVKNKK